MTTKYTLLCQKWEESERGWGSRPDGYSLHLTDENRKAFIQEYWDRMPDTAPDEYERPDGTPYWTEVTGKVFKKVKASGNGVREYGHDLPGSGGTDGWIPTK